MTPLAWVVAGVALAVLTTGCADDHRPVDAVPALSTQLDRVDAAISSGRFGAARTALGDLGDETEQARADGTLDADEADAILVAISALEGQLPEPTGRPSATASPTASATPSAEPDQEKAEEKAEEPPADKPEPKPHPEHGKKPKGSKEPKEPKKEHPKPHGKPGHGPKH